MKWLKDWLFSRNLQARLRANEVKKEAKNQSSYIGILVDELAIDSMSKLDKIISDWQGKGKKVEKLAYVDTKELPEESVNQFCNKDLNWFQAPKSELIDEFCKKNFDILITLNPEHRKFINYINAVSNAKFKIGLEEEDLPFNNLIIECKTPSKVQTAFQDIQITLDKLAI